MAELQNESEKPRRSRLAPWLNGMIWGELFWGLMASTTLFMDALERAIQGRFQRFEMFDSLDVICGVLAFPIALGGWLFIWGDGPQPPEWITSSLPFNIAFGLVFYGLIGAMLGHWLAQRRRPHYPPCVRGLFWGVMFWFSMFLVMELGEAFDQLVPEWIIPDILFIICGFLAFPIEIGGWMFIWADNGPPFPWMASSTFNITFGVIFYGLIGALIRQWLGKARYR